MTHFRNERQKTSRNWKELHKNSQRARTKAIGRTMVPGCERFKPLSWSSVRQKEIEEKIQTGKKGDKLSGQRNEKT